MMGVANHNYGAAGLLMFIVDNEGILRVSSGYHGI